jgi:hypothetical protein
VRPDTIARLEPPFIDLHAASWTDSDSYVVRDDDVLAPVRAHLERKGLQEHRVGREIRAAVRRKTMPRATNSRIA